MKAKLSAPNLTVELGDDGLLALRSDKLPLEVVGVSSKGFVEFDGQIKAVIFDRFTVESPGDNFLAIKSESEGLRLELSFSVLDEGVLVQPKLINAKHSNLKINELRLISAQSSAGKIRIGACDPFDLIFFKNGWQSWSATYPTKVSQPDFSPHTKLLRLTQEDVTRPCSGRDGEHFSDMVTFIHDPTSHATLAIGFVDTGNFFGEIGLVANPVDIMELRATLFADGIFLSPNSICELDALWFGLFESDEFALERWANICAKRMNARVGSWNPKGWCSWYYYLTRISEANLRENLNVLGEVRTRLGLDVFLIDDGYEKTVGDWLELKRKFSADFKSLVAEIKATGFIAGIWLAPFIATSRSKVFSEHPDWFLKDEKEKPVWAGLNPLWRANFYALDPTHPEVQGYLEQVLKKMLEAGFEYFKLDFLYSAALVGRASVDGLTRAQRLRHGLEFIRSVLGDKFIVGCGCPLGPAVGLVDAMRIGPDVAPFWSEDPLRQVLRDQHALCAKNAVRNSVNRLFMHRRLWLNDSDCVIVRKNRSRLRLDEVKALCATAISCSGLVFFSDVYEKLDAERVAILGKTMANVFSSSHLISPTSYNGSVIIAGKIGDKKAIAVLNPSDEPKFVPLEFNKFGISSSALRELFSNELVRSFEGAVEIPSVPHHGAVVLTEEVYDE